MNNIGHDKIPVEKNDLIVYMLIEKAMNDDYIRRHEQMKVLKERDYFKKWGTTKY